MKHFILYEFMETRLCKLLNAEGMKHFILYEFMETRLCKLF